MGKEEEPSQEISDARADFEALSKELVGKKKRETPGPKAKELVERAKKAIYKGSSP